VFEQIKLQEATKQQELKAKEAEAQAAAGQYAVVSLSFGLSWDDSSSLYATGSLAWQQLLFPIHGVAGLPSS
jgi:hypothetical protein